MGRTIVVAGPSAEVGFEWRTGDRGSPDPSASSSASCASASPRQASETADPAPSGSARAGPRARRPLAAQRLERACGRQVSAPPRLPPPAAGRKRKRSGWAPGPPAGPRGAGAPELQEARDLVRPGVDLTGCQLGSPPPPPSGSGSSPTLALPGSPSHWLHPSGHAPTQLAAPLATRSQAALPTIGFAPEAPPPVQLALPLASSGSLSYWPLAPGSLSPKALCGSQLVAVVCSRGHSPSGWTSLLLCLRLVLLSAGSLSPGLDP